MSNSSMQQGPLVGVFNNEAAAQQAIHLLIAAGFSAGSITIFDQDNRQAQDLADATGATVGQMGGNSSEGFLDKLGDLFTADNSATTTTGLSGLGLDAQQAEMYENALRQGNIVVAVMGGGQHYSEGLRILQGGSGDYSANSSTTTTTTTQQTAAAASNVVASGATAADMHSDKLVVPVVEESLSATKRSQQAGEVVVNKHVVEEQVNIPVELRHEEVTVTRHVVDRPVAAGEATFQDGAVINVPLYEETVSVQKQAHVTGEVEINKQAVAEQHTVSDTVRREVVDVDTAGDVQATNSATTQDSSKKRAKS